MRYLPFALVLISFSCSERVPDHLYYQFSPDSSTIVYKYLFNSGYAFTSPRTGFKIGNANQGFSMSLPDLDASYISGWSSGTDLTAVKIEFQGKKSSKPIKSSVKIGQSKIELLEYSLSKYTSSEYKFDSLSTDQDKIRFYGINKVYGSSKYDRSVFKKGPVIIESTKDREIIEIQIDTLIPFQNHFQHMTFRLKPKKPLSIDQINSSGIFKEAKSW